MVEPQKQEDDTTSGESCDSGENSHCGGTLQSIQIGIQAIGTGGVKKTWPQRTAGCPPLLLFSYFGSVCGMWPSW
jgi:hypothetical protein